MKAKRSADTPVCESKTKGGLENPPSCIEEDSGKDRGMSDWQICAVLTLEEKTATHERKHDQLQDLFHTLLHELMTGLTRVHEVGIRNE